MLPRPEPVFAGSMIAAVVLLGRKAWRRPSGSIIFLTLAAAAVLPFGVIYRAFGQVDMMSFLFHAQAGIAGVRPEMLLNHILATLFSLIGILLICYLASSVRWMRWLPLVIGVALVVFHPFVVFQAKRLLLPVPDMDLAARLIEPVIAANPLPPDIVHVYLEGLDRRFFDPELGPETAGMLRGLEAQGLSFTDIREVAGTGWSIAGMVASQCGVPLLPRGNLNNDIIESIGESFLPGVTCLGDLLAGRGYSQTFIMGAEAKFAGTAAFYVTHQYQTILAQKDMVALFPPDEVQKASVTWFADDQMTYDLARTVFSDALGQDAPILLTIATIGPHGVPNYLSRECTADAQAVATDDVFLAAHCLTRLTERLVADIQDMHRQSGRPNELRIILQSDHLNHARQLLPDDATLKVNTLILIGGAESGVSVATPGTMMDVYPTLLEWLDFPAVGGKAGLGVSLLSPEAGESLVEVWDLPVLDRVVMNSIPMFAMLWEGSH
ncbi:sulfatase-like hydrolase/transferase [Rhodobacter sp. SY28-1]|uniref:sulfatase-like hydrolase/transferase n=1 Tax=Rhodobacter sp. SY28-1 TaxID=2562317 RepID=UPI0014856592|nr:sulfatase-like hydrolase/transferase [Rhodobacter sp. SY28-1]